MAIRDQLMSALSQYGQSLALPVMPRDQEQMFDLYANRPDFAANYYPTLQNQQRIDIGNRQENRLQAQQDALSQLALKLGGGDFNTRSALAQLAAATGDPTALIKYQMDEEEKKRELQKQQAIQSIMGGALTPTGINPAAQNELNRTFQNSQSPLSVRNNNAGNLRDPKTGDFRQFATPQDGIEAMARDLTAKVMGRSPAMIAQHGQGYVPSLTNILTTYAPPSENDTQGYIDFVSKQSGIDPNVPLSPMDISRIMPAMIKMEGGGDAANYFGGAIPQNAPQQSQQEIPQNSPSKEPSAAEQMKVLAQIDPQKTQQGVWSYLEEKLKAEKEQSKMADSVITENNAGLTGQAFLDTIENKDVKNKAQAIIEGRAPFPNVNSRTPNNIKMALEAAQQADPTLNAATYPMRAKAAKDFSSGGQEAKNINALNTAINHLEELQKASDDLENSGFTYWNTLANKTKGSVDDKFNSKLKRYESALDAVSSEVAKVYKGAGALSVSEQESWKHNFSSSNGPEANRAAINETGKLLMGKIDALNKQYNDAFGGTIEKDFVSPKAKTILDKLGVTDQSQSNGGWKVEVVD